MPGMSSWRWWRLGPARRQATGAVDLGFTNEVEQMLEFLFRFAGTAGDEGAANHEVPDTSRQRASRSRFFSPLAGRFMRFSTSG